MAKTLDRSESPTKKVLKTLACCLPNCFFFFLGPWHSTSPEKEKSHTPGSFTSPHPSRPKQMPFGFIFSSVFCFFSRFSEFSLAVSRPVMRDLHACRARRFTKISFSCAPGDGQGDNQASSCLQVPSF